MQLHKHFGLILINNSASMARNSAQLSKSIMLRFRWIFVFKTSGNVLYSTLLHGISTFDVYRTFGFFYYATLKSRLEVAYTPAGFKGLSKYQKNYGITEGQRIRPKPCIFILGSVKEKKGYLSNYKSLLPWTKIPKKIRDFWKKALYGRP